MKKLAIVSAFLFAIVAGAPAQAAKISPEKIDGATTVAAGEAKGLFDRGVTFIDVRKDSDWDAGRVPGAHHIELKKKFDEPKLAAVVGKEKEVVIYCNGPKCMRSSKACAKAVGWGFSKVYYFRGGFPEWEAAGYPVE
ncbi:MAG: rhodanese-like domain-containing protein [Alphaproteobacteria bacterium]|jgi:rhodanese-related sulfurtransferase|nr:rhodanese-like domain-containing protein [Alphaproteobacteria bacterium]MDP6567670.1 rhodanese-like domain-containing protein [Alphaproteobacteria bacterium]MDP6813194.1 rhodanese-like domain-containing protein [Alphaproteobacteria bacterium]